MRVIDSHTAGEPTRIVIEGGPDLGDGSLAERAKRLAASHEQFRCGLMLEPRGHDALVGGLLTPPTDPSCATGVIYFNNVGNLGMCGHATIGLAVTLAHLGRIELGRHRFETPVGVVTAEVLDANTVRVKNVESYRLAKDVAVDVQDIGRVVGDVAWGGNWFFLTKDAPCDLHYEHVDALTRAAFNIRHALVKAGVTGAEGAEIDHIEFLGPPKRADAHGRNFVLCPGGAYDRSPCGTGTSAKLACLAADHLLEPGVTWIQESIIGSVYQTSYQPGLNGGVIPDLVGQAFVTGESFDLLQWRSLRSGHSAFGLERVAFQG